MRQRCRGAPSADGQFLFFWSIVMIPPAGGNCCVTLLLGADKSWLNSCQVRLVQFKWAAKHPPVLCVDWDQSVPPQCCGSSLQVVKQWWLWGGRHLLQLAWTSPEDNIWPWPYSASWRAPWPLTTVSWTADVCNFRCLQVTQGRWRETLLISSEPARFSFPYSFMYND